LPFDGPMQLADIEFDPTDKSKAVAGAGYTGGTWYSIDGGLNLVFCGAINRAGRVVKHENARVDKKGISSGSSRSKQYRDRISDACGIASSIWLRGVSGC